MPRPTKVTSSLEVVSRLQETAEPITLTPWQMRIVQALKLQGATVSVMSADKTNLELMTTPTTVTPVTLLKLFAAENITVAVAPYTSKKVAVTYSRLERV